MYALIIFLPLLGALIAGLLSLYQRDRAAEMVTISGLLLSLLLSTIAFANVAIGGVPETVNLARWISSGSFVANWSLRFDTLTAVMLIVVTGVSSMVHVVS
jgi:NADH-quinone oxidoreductase subunit L